MIDKMKSCNVVVQLLYNKFLLSSMACISVMCCCAVSFRVRDCPFGFQ